MTSLRSSNGNYSFYNDVKDPRNQPDVIDKKYEQCPQKDEHHQQYDGHQAKLDELLIGLNDVRVSLSSDEYAESSFKDHGNDSHGACNVADIELHNSEAHQIEPSGSKITLETRDASTEDLDRYSSRSKVKYDKGNLAKSKEANDDEKKENWRDVRQECLPILYAARGRQIEDLTMEIEFLKNDSAREITILKHRLSVAEGNCLGEKEHAAKNLENVQSLLQESRSENAQLLCRIQTCESQTERLKEIKEELLQKLKTAESAIEAQQQHMNELGFSDTLTRARQDYENVLNGLQKKYDSEIKHLKETIDHLNATTHEKDAFITVLMQKLSESRKKFDSAQASRTKVIHRFLQYLEQGIVSRKCLPNSQDMGSA